MAAYRRCGRLMGLALVTGPLVAAGFVWASPARADDASYLSHLHGAGIQDEQGGDADLVQVGHKLCTELQDGATPNQLEALALQRSDSSLGGNGLSPEQADALVNYARVDLCPGAALNPGEPQWPGAAGIP
jgi:Protein of unknown function (DUF732)